MLLKIKVLQKVLQWHREAPLFLRVYCINNTDVLKSCLVSYCIASCLAICCD